MQRGRPSHQILNELAADAACTDDQNFDGGEVGSGELLGVRHPCGGLFACSLQGGHAPIEWTESLARPAFRASLGGGEVTSRSFERGLLLRSRVHLSTLPYPPLRCAARRSRGPKNTSLGCDPCCCSHVLIIHVTGVTAGVP